MRKTCLFLIFFLMGAAVAFAAPLTDYTLGETALDLAWRPNLNMDLTNTIGVSREMQGERSNFEYGITVGLGHRFALQYRDFDPDTKVLGTSYRPLDSDEINLLYKLDDGLSVFVGSQRVKYTQINTSGTVLAETEYDRAFQYGLVWSKDIGHKLTPFVVAGGGHHVTNFELGLAYPLADNLDFNVSYRVFKAKDMKYTTTDVYADYSVKGMGYGVTYRF